MPNNFYIADSKFRVTLVSSFRRLNLERSACGDKEWPMRGKKESVIRYYLVFLTEFRLFNISSTRLILFASFYGNR